ncbi:hypothetical protein N7471_001687 [Penicillium samsonianum]|uniref:uncharacterized protein n=1 Tax=Penicillium samsonianum TaxID=1882272 RepID=UPI002548D7F8|nr:uncharacterized protein N7471_001687 [Penicillium samsonianum]KAJ6150488.1 hypothetical protein N7471_001687 [Penicillium samsonianum]
MAQTPENKAAWLSGSKVTPLEVGPAPYTQPGPHQIVGKGLEKIQEAFGIHMQAVSAKKIVVSL